MSSTIEQAKEAILKRGGMASKHQIARELKISLEYASLILVDLKSKGEIAFSDGFYSLTSAKRDVTQYKEQEKPAMLPPTRRTRKSKRTKKAKGKKRPMVKNSLPHPLANVLGISESLARILEEAGYATVESLAEAPINILIAATKLELHTAAHLINQARKIKRKN